MTPGERSPVYLTRQGAKKLQDELAGLLRRTRPAIVQEVADAAAQGDRSENAEYIYGKKKLREIDRRIHFLTKRLESATVVEARTAQQAGQLVLQLLGALAGEVDRAAFSRRHRARTSSSNT